MVPKLRFKEFTNKWCECLLGNLVDIKSGNSPSTYELSSEGNYPFVKVEDMNNCTKYQIDAREYVINSQFCFPAGSIIFPKRGAAIMNNKVRILNQNSCADTNMMALIATYIKPEFLYYLVNLIGLYKIADTSTIPQINNKHILSFKVNIPSDEEQTKIADFLSSVDEKITLLNQQYDLLCQYKKGMMQKIFSQKIRFKNNDGSDFLDWRKVRLSECLYEHKKRNKKLIYNKEQVLSVSGDVGIVNQIELLGRSYAGESVENYHIAHQGDIVYTKSPLKENPFGIIKSNKGNSGIVSTLYAVYSCRDCIDHNYIDYYFSRKEVVNNYLKPLVNKGAKNDMKVNNQHVLTGDIVLPSREEQKKIVSLLSMLDDKIAVKKAELDKLKTWKQGLLQQMFV